MQKQSGIKWRGIGIAMMAAVLFVALLATSSVPAPALAQVMPEPTTTPSDPAWRGYVVARDAIEEERSVDLTYVQQYTYEQTEFEFGIDWGCDEDVVAADVRPVWHGWTFRITDMRGNRHEARVAFDLSAVVVCDEVSEGGSAPEAPPAERDPNLPDPVAGSGATGDFELGGHVDGLGPQAVTYMQQAGMTWVKKQLRFNLGDGTGLAQTLIDDARGKGFKILLGIVGQPTQMNDFNSYVESYADFVGQVAALGPDAIEVWNEPNIDREWPTGQISGANYTQLLAASYNAIKTANPSVMVISGAPAPTGAEAVAPQSIMNDDRFMQEMRAAGATDYMDCLGLHYNEGIVAPSASSGDPRDNYPTRYFGSMLARGANIFPDRPVCWTELGYLTGEGMGQPIPDAFNWAQDVTLAQQASWLAEAVSISAQSGRVRLLIVWNVNFTRWDSDPMGGYAMMRPDSSCPACGPLGTVMGG